MGSTNRSDLELEHPVPDDYLEIIRAIEDWWTVPLRRLANGLVQRLFLEHFANTSFVLRDQSGIAAFLIGFVSQVRRDQAYIHFVGVAPRVRRRGIASVLYERFFETVRQRGCDVVRCITSPNNKESLGFHRELGFRFLLGPASEGGIPIHPDHGGPGIAAVVMEKNIAIRPHT